MVEADRAGRVREPGAPLRDVPAPRGESHVHVAATCEPRGRLHRLLEALRHDLRAHVGHAEGEDRVRVRAQARAAARAYCGSTAQSASTRSSARRVAQACRRRAAGPSSARRRRRAGRARARRLAGEQLVERDLERRRRRSRLQPDRAARRRDPQHGRPRAQVGLLDGAGPRACRRRQPLVDPVRRLLEPGRRGPEDRLSVTPRRPPCARGCTPTTGAPACRRRRRRRRGTCRAGRGRGACRPARRGARTARRRPARGGRRSSWTPRRSSLRAIAGPTLGIEVSALMTPCSRGLAVRSWRDRTDRPRRAANAASQSSSFVSNGRPGSSSPKTSRRSASPVIGRALAGRSAVALSFRWSTKRGSATRFAYQARGPGVPVM